MDNHGGLARPMPRAGRATAETTSALEDEGCCRVLLPVGPFPVTWSQLLTSVQTAVLLFPVNLVTG